MIKLKDLLNEIGEATAQPYFTKDELQDYSDEFGVQGSFETDSDIEVEYEFADEQDGGYIFSFSVEGSTQQGLKSTMSVYLRIMATVFEALKKFIEEQDPEYIKLTGDDKLGSTGQKNRIYVAYLEKNKSYLNSAGYKMKQDGNELLLVKK
jgi:hypothetical protein